MSRFTKTTVNAAPPVMIQNAQGETVPAPDPVVPNLINRLNPTRYESTDDGHPVIIHCQPDYREPNLAWMFSIATEIQNADYTSSPVASPASLLAYTNLMFTALHYQIDQKLCPQITAPARSIARDNSHRDFFDALLDLAVPSFAINEFEAVRPYQDELANNLMYFGTLAGSDFYHDFGRYPPVYMFLRLHNLMASLPNNSTYATLVREFYISTIATIRLPGANQNTALTPSHFLGRYITDATPATTQHRNWFNDAFDRFITTNAIRVVNATATVSRIPLFTPTHADMTNFNVYTFLTGHTDENDTQLSYFVRNMNDFTMRIFPTSRPLRNYVQVGTIEIARHLAFEQALPTWHTLAAPTNAAALTDAIINGGSSSRSDFASAITYGVARLDPSDNNAGNTLAVYTPRAAADPHQTDAVLSLVAAHADPRPPNGAAIRIINDANVNQFDVPPCMIFDPSSNEVAHHIAAITSGKKIEANDLSAIGINLPKTRFSLGLQNSYHIQGAIPIDLITAQLSQERISFRRRNDDTNARNPQLIVRGYESSVTIPRFSTGLIRLVTQTAQAVAASTLNMFPGALQYGNLRDSRDGLNVFIQPLGAATNANAPEKYLLWSSYRYYDDESKKWHMLPTLRHIYGSRARLTVTQHPANRIR